MGLTVKLEVCSMCTQEHLGTCGDIWGYMGRHLGTSGDIFTLTLCLLQRLIVLFWYKNEQSWIPVSPGFPVHGRHGGISGPVHVCNSTCTHNLT